MSFNILEKNVKHVWGQKGQNWLSRLDSIIETLSRRWHLINLSPVKNMSYNFVASAMHRKNIPVVLKISCDDQLIHDEYKALMHFKGHSSIKVLDMSAEFNALLLEQAIPGFLLKDHQPPNLNDTIHIYVDIVKALSSCALEDKNSFTHVSKWCEAIDRIADSRVDSILINKAKTIRMQLLDSLPAEYICHGDLHLQNIILDRNRWVAIDPKGIVGEMAFEAAAFDLMKDRKNSVAIKEMITLLSEALNIDYHRLLCWFFLRSIISAQWFIEDQGDPNETLYMAEKLHSILIESENSINKAL